MTEPASREEALDTREEENLSARPLHLFGAVPTSDGPLLPPRPPRLSPHLGPPASEDASAKLASDP